ncbi:MAG: hypothetical protein E7515_07375 [Ruminococcaceae bacterium]|nr:hypothetical protein [Oscillospiraceae bacterium]
MKKPGLVTKATSLFISLCLVICMLPTFSIFSFAQTITVTTLQALKDALSNEAYDEIVVANTITLTDGTELYANGKTVRAQKTGVDEQGIVQTGSDYNVFKTAANATVHIYDMVIMGGSVSAIVNETGKLYLDNVTITRSGSETNAGGAIVNGVQKLQNGNNVNHNTAYVVMKNSSIVRNVAIYGGGFMNYGTLIMDGCSLSENRSINNAGGGGAGENEGYAYLNNCTVANNTSSEIGGGINVCKGGELYIMNCTFTGNVTYCNGGANYGGAIGDNNCVVKAVNSIFANNYYINKSSQTVTPCDIGLYQGTNVTAYNSIVGSVSGGTATLENCSSNTDGLFAAYVTGNVLAGDGTESTADFSKPAVVQNSSGELYTPVSGDYQGDIEGVPTYFDYSDLDNIRMYFTDEDSEGNTDTTFFAGSGIEATDLPVDNALDDGDRETTLIGSSNSLGEGKTIYTIKVIASEHGSIKGGTIYGDSYIVVSDGSVVSVEDIVTVTLEATPDSGYYFDSWQVVSGGGESSEVASLAAELEELKALKTSISDAISDIATSLDDINTNISYANNTTNSTTTQNKKRALIEDTNTLVNALNGYKTTFSSFSDVVSTITSANLSTKTYARRTSFSTWCNSVVSAGTTVSSQLNAHLQEVQQSIDAKQAEYDAAVAAADAELGIDTGNNPMEFVVNSNITLKALFTAIAPDYTVTFHSNTEPETTVTQTFAAGNYTANLTANTFTNEGQPFLGWAQVYCGDVVYADGASYTANGNADLYARWGYTVDFNANGGRNVPDSQIKNPGEGLTISSVAPTRDGYKFKGWGISADATDAVIQPGDVYGVDKNVTFYAIWEELKVPTVLDTTLDNGYLDVPYSDKIETDQDAIFILADGSTLPEGLTISKDGQISGTPSSTGTYTFEISVYNKDDTSLNNSSTITLTITIADPKSALRDLVDEANAVDQDKYTDETAQNLQNAIDQGQSVLDDTDATLNEINEAIEALKDALNQLSLDKSALAEAIAQGKAITENETEAAKYTQESLAVLENALTAGDIVYENTKASAEQIAQATQAILDAINNLKREANKDTLQDLIDEAKQIDQDDYTDDTANDLQDAIDNAEDVINNPDATPEEIADAIEQLENAINNLKPDKSELEQAITDGNEILGGDTDSFTPESVQALENAVQAGEAVDADPDATVEEIKQATEAIKNALENLLEEAVENAENTDTTGMTSESVQNLENVINEAKDVINNPDATTDEIANAIKAVEEAIDNLTPDKTELEEVINNAESIDTTNVPQNLVDALEDAINNGKDVDNNPDATVPEVKDAVDDIVNAIDNILQDVIDEAKNTDTDGYTPVTASNLEDAIQNAEDVINNPDATPQEKVDAINALTDAINNLNPDKTELEETIDAAETIDTTGIPEDLVNALEDAINNGNNVDGDPDATVPEIKDATDAINDAIDNILQNEIDEANNTDTDGYTDETKQALEDAVQHAEDVLNNPDSTPQDKVDAINELNDAIDNLTPDKTELEEVIDAAETIDTTGLPEDLADALEDAINNGNNVDGDPDATVPEVKDATDAINDAIDNILQDVIDDAKDKDTDDLTDESKQALEEAIQNAEDVINNPDSTPQEKVDAINELKDVINDLETTKLIPTTDGGIIVDRTDTDYYYMVGLDASDTSFASVKAKLENDGRQVIAFRGENQLGDEDHIGTGCVIKCVSVKDPSIVYEQATVILYGDINGDGFIDSVDYDAMFDEALFGVAIEGNLFRIAGDVYHDGTIDGFDMSMVELQMTGAKALDQTVEYYK